MAEDDDIFYHITAPVESIQDYRAGGYHPLHLKDSLLHGRYLILRKLGHGSYSTTWLARDRKATEFVALKIKTATGSDAHEISIHDDLAVGDVEGKGVHLVHLIDHFSFRGPNGPHSGLVFSSMGPSVMGLLHDRIPGEGTPFGRSKRFSLPAARQILLQALVGLDHLHSKNIVHGDFHAGNWLLELQGIDKLSEDDLSQDPSKVSAAVRRLDGKPKEAGDPRHLTIDEPLYRWIATGPDLCIRIADFGNAFRIHEPPDNPQTPVDIRSPELLLKKQISRAQDIWSFGCIVYRLLTNKPLFALFNMGNPDALNDSHALQLIEHLGPLPNDLKHAWANYDQYFDKNDVQTSFRNEWAPEIDDEISSRTPSIDDEDDNFIQNEDPAGEHPEHGLYNGDAMPRPDDQASPFPAHLVPSIIEIYEWTARQDDDDSSHDADDTYTPDLPLPGRFMRDKHPEMTQAEAEVALDLLQRILRYDPAERLTTVELLRHQWIVEFCRTDLAADWTGGSTAAASPQGSQLKRGRRRPENLEEEQAMSLPPNQRPRVGGG